MVRIFEIIKFNNYTALKNQGGIFIPFFQKGVIALKIEMDFEGAQEGIDELIKLLESLNRSIVNRACEEAVKIASNNLVEEMRRRISANPKHAFYRNMLSSYRRFVREYGYTTRCGFSTEVINEHIELLILEFGRPGTGRHALKKHGIDKIGRRIGVIQPAAYIRGAWFAKSEEVKKFLGEYTFNEIRKVWVKKNGK